MAFQVGDEVVCIEATLSAARAGLRVGTSYRAAVMMPCPCCGDPHVSLEELPNQFFPVEWFRKVEKKLTGMGTLRSLLVPTKERVLVE